jgi:hypothetical protein
MSEQLRILERIDAEEISVAEGIRLLEALNVGQVLPDGKLPQKPGPPPWANVAKQVVLGIGIALFLIGAALVASFYSGWLARGWQVAGWILLVLGMVDVLLAWWLQRAQWLSVRVRQDNGSTVTLELSVPLGAAPLAVRLCTPFVPKLRDSDVSVFLAAMRQGLCRDEPLMVEVDDEISNNHVWVRLG